jgi:hypothetical protein
MALTEEQQKAVAAWIEEGAKPADVQARLEKEFEVRMTYMEVRFLIDDLKVMPKDPVPPEPAKPAEPAPEAALSDEVPLEDALPPYEGGGVSVQVDTLTKPGTMVSGRATMTDGKTVEWYLDQHGRLGMVGPEPGYRPPQQDLPAFQAALERELQKMGI